MVNTPIKKKTQQKTPYYQPVLQHGPSKSKLMRKCCVFSPTKGSTLEANISSSVGNLLSIWERILKISKFTDF
jgi:hypothetical protein